MRARFIRASRPFGAVGDPANQHMGAAQFHTLVANIDPLCALSTRGVARRLDTVVVSAYTTANTLLARGTDMSSFSTRISSATFIALALLLTPTAAAQVRIVGDVSGTITDPSGAAVPNAKVVLKDLGTGNVREAAANQAGHFSFPDLSFGKFEITVTAAGFQTSVVANVAVEASKTTDVPIQLQVGQQSQSVTVEAAASPILETTSNLSSDSKQFKQ